MIVDGNNTFNVTHLQLVKNLEQVYLLEDTRAHLLDVLAGGHFQKRLNKDIHTYKQNAPSAK